MSGRKDKISSFTYAEIIDIYLIFQQLVMQRIH